MRGPSRAQCSPNPTPLSRSEAVQTALDRGARLGRRARRYRGCQRDGDCRARLPNPGLAAS